MADRYIALERDPDEGLVLFHQCLQSDPARREDWKAAIDQAMPGGGTDPFAENLDRGE